MIQVVEDTIAVEQIHPLRESMIHPLAGDRHRLAVADHVGYRDPGQHIGGTNAEIVDVPAPATFGRGGVQAGRDPARQDVLIAVTDAAPDLGTPDTAHHRLRVEDCSHRRRPRNEPGESGSWPGHPHLLEEVGPPAVPLPGSKPGAEPRRKIRRNSKRGRSSFRLLRAGERFPTPTAKRAASLRPLFEYALAAETLASIPFRDLNEPVLHE